ncbi:Hypothetical protein SRAE_X000036200 [Strongyloides ratti]|uniref:VWFA domain-containing protein n=1 Tax=Strongyloides ratti TaxID=34506 RepID=A0A090LMF8_STRRB|nr:Hypothetical protein SRAE_X000036200 [Strongyloides ratti]CEF71035.1 Hypothetical protein SRAE_X000036200 [Strongyloides ratti]
MFFFDNSIYGKNSFSKQIKIVNEFVLNSPNEDDSISIVLLSKGETSYNSSFYPIPTYDYGEFYTSLAAISNQPPAKDNISYFVLTSDVASKNNLSDVNLYTKNPILVYFIDSYINRIEDTRNILNMISEFSNTTVKVVSIIFDTMKFSTATFLTKDFSSVHLSTDHKETSQWLYKQYQISQ